MMTVRLGFDIGSNSVGSAWIDHGTGEIATGLSVFPAGVDEADDKRGEPKNAKRRATRRARITLARRAARKRQLRLLLISGGLLPTDADVFKKLLEETDPWDLRRRALTAPLLPHEFGRVVLHLAQRRGASGFDADLGDKGKVKKAITDLQIAMLDAYGSDEIRQSQRELNIAMESLGQKKRFSDEEQQNLEKLQEKLKRLSDTLLQNPQITFGRFIADLRDNRRTAITTPDQRRNKRGPREWRQPVRNKAGQFEFHADRAMIRNEFSKLWTAQKAFAGPLATLMTDELRIALDNESPDSVWRHKGELFGQRRQSWDLGTLGRCVLEPTERCAPHADMYASRFLVVETVNNLKIIERNREARSLDPYERTKIKAFLSGPLGIIKKGKQKGLPKRTVTVTDLRELMGWGVATKTSQVRFNIESDEDREINTDWFSREIIHNAITREKWEQLSERARDGINRAILKHDPDEEQHADKLKQLVMGDWAGLNEHQADSLITAWKKRPRPDSKRLKMSRRAVRNLLTIMDRSEPWPDPERQGQLRWLTQIEARMLIADNQDFLDVTANAPLSEHAKRRYATGAKGATARDRHYMKKHILMKSGEPICDPDGNPLREPPPAPLISNPVVRKAIHEVRRHLIDYLKRFGRKPDEIYIELAREAKMGKKDADNALERNRLRNRIRKGIIREFDLDELSSTQREEAVKRVVLAVQQGCVCPLCGKRLGDATHDGMTLRTAAEGKGVELAHIIPKASGGNNGMNNLVLAHIKCNRDMARRTPRGFWDATVPGGFEQGMRWVEGIYSDISRPKLAETKNAEGPSLWSCYFAGGPRRWGQTFDELKIEQFKKDVKDIQGMTDRQLTATRYAARQVMTYLADVLFDGKGLPERGGDRRIFASDGLWTSRLRREWGLYFDRHGKRQHSLTNDEARARAEKDRGDHRHHAIDAVVIALSTAQTRNAWDARERQADQEGFNTADEEVMQNYRSNHRLDPPLPFTSTTFDEFRKAVEVAVYGAGPVARPVAHRPEKRKLIGAFHEETLLGPVVDKSGKLTDSFTAKKSVLDLEPNHLRMPVKEASSEAIKRISETLQTSGLKPKEARIKASQIVDAPDYEPKMVDPPPGKSGIVRDLALRKRIRECLRAHLFVKKNKNGETVGEGRQIDPDNFSDAEIKQVVEAGKVCQASGVPIRSVVLLRTMSDPVIVQRKRPIHGSNKSARDENPASQRAYLGGNNHHIEIRVAAKKNGLENWSGKIITGFEAAQRKLAKLREIRAAGVPKASVFRKLPKPERAKWTPILREAERRHPIVNRSDHPTDGKFVMSLAEGEMLHMRHKLRPEEVGYFVVAKLDKPQSIVLVPHWDARSATERKDAEGNKVADSKREQFAATPNDLVKLAPPGFPHAVKIRVSALGDIQILKND